MTSLTVGYKAHIPSNTFTEQLETVSKISFEKSVILELCIRVRSVHKEYLNTFKAIHFGSKETLTSKLIREAFWQCPTHSSEEVEERLLAFKEISCYLKRLNNAELQKIIRSAQPIGVGLGGDVFRTRINAISVIIKKIPCPGLLEQNQNSTRNIYQLPQYYQYGLGSLGFGTREVAACELTTQWVLDDKCHNFPLMYHKAVLKRSVKNYPNLRMTREEYLHYWNDSKAVKKRIDDIAQADVETVIFMEDLSQTIDAWCENPANRQSLDHIKIDNLIREANYISYFMRSHSFLHFDLNPFNIYYNNGHIYFSDFGLSTSRSFDLDAEEEMFLNKHLDYDRSYLAKTIANVLLVATKKDRRVRIITKYLRGENISSFVPDEVSKYANQHQKVVMLIDNFLEAMRTPSKHIEYPSLALRSEWEHI